ncbi:MAG: alpha-2-macroglobulin, partial [Cupriavidus sp.]|nr:alpha-2-macroglobulin [Cupriavidus sp.]
MIGRIATAAAATAAGLVVSALTWAPAASAAQITRFSPEGVNPQVRQVAIRFDEPMVPMGDLKAAAPASVSCLGGVGGSGRWVNATNWVYDFERDLPPGVRCTVQIASSLKSVAGKVYAGKSEYRFETGGPIVISARPSGGLVEEDQVFALRFNGAATAGSIRAHAWCQAEGLGERIPVRLLTGKERDSVIEALAWKEVVKRDGDAVHLLACQQRLPAGARMQLVLDAGIATPSGLATTAARRFDFQVRDPFAAGFTCERERAEAPCTPLRPMTVTFTAPISRKVAEGIVMKTPSGPKTPSFDPDDAPDAPVSTVTFKGPFPEKASLTIEAPKDLKDESGRALSNADLFPIKLTTAALPPLAKFAAAPFGVVERFADLPRGKSANDYPPLLPVTLRNVEADLPTLAVRAEAGTVARLKVDDDGAILRWFGMVKRMHENTWTKEQIAAIRAGHAPYSVQSPRNAPAIETRSVSLLEGVAGAKKLAIPKSTDTTPRPFEVVGIPLPEPGFHVVEIASPMLGEALLGKKAPMYVRTAALVTNLGVHFKLARGEGDGDMSGLAWVTTLDDGKPVANARVAVRSCEGELLGQGTTDATGVARFA